MTDTLLFIFWVLPIMLLGPWALLVIFVGYPLGLLFAAGYVLDKYTRKFKARKAEEQSARCPPPSQYAPQRRY